MLAVIISICRLSLFLELLHLDGVYPRNSTSPRSWMDVEALLGRIGGSKLTYLALAHWLGLVPDGMPPALISPPPADRG